MRQRDLEDLRELLLDLKTVNMDVEQLEDEGEQDNYNASHDRLLGEGGIDYRPALESVIRFLNNHNWREAEYP